MSTHEPMPRPIYELVDSSDPEQYFTLGLFLTRSGAMLHLVGTEPPSTEFDPDFVRIEVREREPGLRPHDLGRTVASRTWTRGIEESDPTWIASEIKEAK